MRYFLTLFAQSVLTTDGIRDIMKEGDAIMKFEYERQEPNFAIKTISILKVTRNKDYKYSYRNGRLKHGFIYTVCGAMRYTFLQGEKKTICAEAGELIFIPQSCCYYNTYLEDDTETKIVQFDLLLGELPEYLSKPAKIDLPHASELIDAFFKIERQSPSNLTFHYMSCFYGLLCHIDDYYLRMPTKYKKLNAALSEISEHYSVNSSIEHYATLCDMSEVNFRRLFKEYTGKSPVEYRNDIRLENARIKLQSGEYNVSEAAYDSGFSNLSFFIRLYKKKYGHTPKKE